MKDPWLKQLRSRSLIVRHAAWVTLCATEQFVMPIADYTLDDCFDEANIFVHKPPALIQLANSNSKQVTGKRPFDHEDHPERPNKRARVEDEGSSNVNLHAKPSTSQDEKIITSEEATEEKAVRGVDHLVLGDDSKRVSIPPQTSLVLKQKSVSHRVKKFESLIHPKRHSPPTSNIKVITVPKSTLNPHALFWNDLFSKSFSRDQDCRKKLMLKIDDLIDAPSVKAGIFSVNETFLGKRFINKDYD